MPPNFDALRLVMSSFPAALFKVPIIQDFGESTAFWARPQITVGGPEEELRAPEDTLKAERIPEGALTIPQSPGETVQKLDAYSTHRQSATVTYAPPGTKLQADTVPFPRPNLWWEDGIAVFMMVGLFCTAFAALPVGAFVLYLAVFHFNKAAVSAIAVFLGVCCLEDSKISMPFRHHWVFDCVRRHYRLRCIAPPLPYIQPHKTYLLAQFPHATFPLAVWLNAATVGLPASGFPKPMRAVVADVLLGLPVFKHLFQLMGCVSAEKDLMLPRLRNESLGIIPEGIAGCTHGATPEEEKIYINQRFGFVKIAIQAGADIVPIYHLGNSQLMKFYGLGSLSRKFKCTIGWFVGRWGCPFPRQHDIVSLVGKPVEVIQCDEPTDEYVREIHAKVVETLRTNYYAHRHLLPGWEKKELLMV